MAQEDSATQQKQMAEGVEEQQLKYLQFVQVAALHAAVHLSNAYGYAKEKSGPLRTSIESAEGALKTAAGPVYDKYQALPADLLAFVDGKVDESVTKVASSYEDTAQKAPEIARAAALEFKQRSTSMAKSVYSKYEPKAKQCAVCAWRKLNELPGGPKVAEVIVPTAAYCSEKYNHTLSCAAEKGYRVASYMPLIPTEKFAKDFGGNVPEAVQ
ncbi:stress-related protein-like [Argentina anserina]|uniref:stress-related protein-like n=1 Tax=Argentina anserina TaxID=57926 RepID=UPI0021767E75|nr:stress-related protein-like [Potentilla anserina]